MVCYKYKDGSFLKSLYMGDGDYELTLSNELTTDCVFETYWGLSYIIANTDGIYDDNDEFITSKLLEDDFTMHEVDIKII